MKSGLGSDMRQGLMVTNMFGTPMSIMLIRMLGLLTATLSAAAGSPSVPRTNDVARYERVQPVFRSKDIPRERGDMLLALLEGGRELRERRMSADVVCALPEQPRVWIAVVTTHGTTNCLGFTHEGGMVYLTNPNGIFVVSDEARGSVGRVLAELDADLRREVTMSPRPCKYKVGTVLDTSTLSDIAKLFYGDASKWRRIYEANREIIGDPDLIQGNETLIIPDLK